MNRESGDSVQTRGFWTAGLVSAVLAFLKVTVATYWSWWRVMLPLLTILGHNALYILTAFVSFRWLKDDDEESTSTDKYSRIDYHMGDALFVSVFGQPVATRRGTRLGWFLAMLWKARFGGFVFCVEPGCTLYVLVKNCPRPQSRAHLRAGRPVLRIPP